MADGPTRSPEQRSRGSVAADDVPSSRWAKARSREPCALTGRRYRRSGGAPGPASKSSGESGSEGAAARAPARSIAFGAKRSEIWTMGIRDLLAAVRRRRAEPEPQSYRYPAPTSVEQLLAEIEAEHVARARRIRVLERQLAAEGIPPASTPTGREIAMVADVLEGLSRAELPRLNTEELRYLAATVRGLATWTE